MPNPPQKPADKAAVKAPRAQYRKPTIRTESLTAVAAVCNGIAGGGRKATIPGGCTASKLKS